VHLLRTVKIDVHDGWCGGGGGLELRGKKRNEETGNKTGRPRSKSFIKTLKKYHSIKSFLLYIHFREYLRLRAISPLLV
jgi:hypothetical protein